MVARLRSMVARWRRVQASYLWKLLDDQRGWIYALLGAAICNFAVLIGILETLRSAFDDAILDQTEHLQPKVEDLVGLAFLGLLTGLAQRQIVARIGYQLEYQLRIRLYHRLQALDPRMLDGLPTGQLITRAMTDLTLVELLVQLIPTLGVAITLLIALAALIVYMHPLMGAVALLGIPVNAYLISRVRKPLLGFSWLALHRRAEVTTAIDEAVRGIRVVKSFGQEDGERARVRDAAHRAYSVAMGRVRMMARYDLILQAIPVLLNAILLVLAGRAIVRGEFSVGELLIFLIFSRVFTGLAQQFDEIASGWMFAKSGALRIFELLDWGGEDDEAVGPPVAAAGPLPPPTTGLRLHRVEFDVPQLSLPPVELDIGPGRLTMVTGPPGSGKSLLAAVAGGGVAPGQGSVELEGTPLAQLSTETMRRAVRLVDEEPFLFARSIRENLEVGADPGERRPGDERLWAALRAAAAEEFVAALDGGLDAQVGDRGMTLSGGQRQRLALARALVSPPRVLVLDDALSAVNPALELEIIGRLRAAHPAMGILLVTRRPGARQLADQVVELPAPSAAAEPVSWQEGFAAMAARGGLPPDPQLQAAVDSLPPQDEAPVVGDREAADSVTTPTVPNVLRPFARHVAVALGLLLAFTLVSLVPEGLFKIAVDDFEEGVHQDADKVALVLLVVGAALGVLSFLLKIATGRVNEGVLYLLRRRAFQRLSRLGLDYFDRQLPGQVAARVVHDLDRISAFVENGVYQMAVGLSVIAASFAILLVWNSEVGSAVLWVLPLLAVITAIQVPLASRAYTAARSHLGEVVERFQEDVAGRYVIAAFDIRERAEADLVRRARSLRSARRTSTLVSNAYVEVAQMVGWVAMAVVVDRAGNLSIAGSISAGSVIALQLYLARAMAPIPQLSDVLQRYLAARASFRTLRQPWEAPVLPTERPAPAPCPSLEGRVGFRDVTFGYPGTDRTVLHDVSLALEPGTSIALVGETGAGKSSIAKLLARMYDPDDGAVEVDGQDLRDLDLDQYRRRLGIVPQDAFCFRGSVRDNIRYGRAEASDAEIEAAVDAVGGTGILARVPGQLDGFVDEEGRNLTVAQRQVIALARAALLEPDILVLDEATSSLDADVEQVVIDAVAAMGRTAIFVTHRAAVARHADRVAMIDGGRIVEEGTHDELLAWEGRYAALWSDADLELVDGSREVALA